ncbi:MAG TPA: DNA mismatch repair protein MutS [Acetobacteraceae bacterium]|jgi:DNA mismatch repair protein MutS
MKTQAAQSAKEASANGATPAMAQWFAAKAEHPDALLFFRMGDFYEMFFADAQAAATALDIALTRRGEHAGQPIAMCGVPVAAADAYLARLIRRGFRVAVCEQMEDPKLRTGKGPIRREVVRLVTPGTLTEDALLEAGRPNLLLALALADGAAGAAWLDVSTGLFETQRVPLPALPALLGRLDPAEILAPASLDLGDWAARRAPSPDPSTAPLARRRLGESFAAASLDAFGHFSDSEAMAAALGLDYVRLTQGGKLPRLSHPVPLGETGRLELDAATRASLEITRARDGGAAHTLLAAVQRTATASGARLLAEWLSAPLTELEAIGRRQDCWLWLLANPDQATSIRAALRAAPDMARALARLSLGRGGPRDLAALGNGLAAAREAAAALDGPLPGLLAEIRDGLQAAPDLQAPLGRALIDPAPARLDDGAIAAGFDAELDAERGLRDDSRRVIATLQLDYAQKYGVASLKIRHHAQLGYVVEAPAAAVEKLRAHAELTLRQGMANGARFTCPELSELDRRISEAADRAAARERAVFAHLVALALREADALAGCAAALAALDVAQSSARLASSGSWCRPVLSDDLAFDVTAGRHPVVEAALAGTASFIANDCDLSLDRRLLLLTGPNMAGKSTYLRQNALIAILAQAGLPTPAASVRLGVVDRLFSRVGAADDLARGRSTFMVEMTETASILHQAGPRSLVVVDEIGRGTATLDGLAIAWAVLEALHNATRCRTIFATHFHELAQLTHELPRLRPHMMRVKEWKQDVVFLHEVGEGSGGRSWGVHVARLAGVPAPVVKRAGALLQALETRAGRMTEAAALPLFAAAVQDDSDHHIDTGPMESETPDPVRAALAAIDPDRLTPREALESLYRLRSLLTVAQGDEPIT